jgi:hypothetical protein
VAFDNTTNEQVEAWLHIVKELAPRQVMIYSIARDTPCQTLVRVERDELEQIAKHVRALGIEALVG